MRKTKILGVIPARYASKRLPGKVLLDICGKPMIQHVYERALKARSLFALIVATDDARVFEAVRAFGGEVVMTSPDHPNGTARAAEAAERFGEPVDAVINVQGDEPLLDPLMLDELAAALFSGPDVVCATLCHPLSDERRMGDPNQVKVVLDRNGDALYFSRSLIPYPRCTPSVPVYGHIGLYGYDRDFLALSTTLPSTPLAEAESLEQLKILEHGYKIRTVVTSRPLPGKGVDTQEDLEAARRFFAGEGRTS
ncbi:MAG: 3-deoxy-manno-octulosonate cytidylyltransferase [Fretibacterium sp.]|nr:3-deoxy-manno-octulosonate cytidylyltransferase [Fretibacterium sp.]